MSETSTVATESENVPPSDNEKSEVEEKPEEATTNETTKDEWLDVLGSGALMKKVVKEGQTETKPHRNEKCTINYKCWLENDDTEVVDSATNFELYLGEFDVISGLDLALGLMNVEEKSLLKIEPRLAYRQKGLPPKIPGEAVLIYEIELLNVEPEDDVETLTIQQRKAIGNKKRERGNWWYSQGEHNIAIQCYRRALDYLDQVEGCKGSQVTDVELQSILEDRISVYNNMAAAQIKMEMYEPALKSLQTVLVCQPNNVKAHFRKAKVYEEKNDLHMAMKSLQKAKEIAPDDLEINKKIAAIQKLLEKQKVSERELARRMFNVPKNDSKSKLETKSNKNKITLWTTTFGAAVALGVAGFMAYRLKYF